MVLTGAGVSAESGIPTFRDALTGLWENFDASELACEQAYRHDRALVWGWYEWRRMKVMNAQPNPAHYAIAALAERVPRLTVVTQNVDDLHERAGSRDVLHMHGRMLKPRCFACKRPYDFPPGIPVEPEGGRRVIPPRCPHCGGYIRPGVVWFGEMLPEAEWEAASEAASQCDAMLIIGTSSLVYPAASLPSFAIKRGAITIQLNPNPTTMDDQVSLSCHGPAGVVLPGFISSVWPVS